MAKGDKWRYGVVLDAGSSGTRAHVYRWLRNDIARQDPSALHALPILETKEKWTKKQHVGLSTFGETPDRVGLEHLQPLLDHILTHVPSSIVPETPIFLLATAGMRLLPEFQSNKILKNVCSYIQAHTKLFIPDCDLHVQIIPGEVEGLYGWVAANYLLGGFDSPSDHNHGKGHHTYGFLDMGGASSQIAFAPNSSVAEMHANDLKLMRLRTVDGASQEHRVFVTSWLGFGVNEARKRYHEELINTYVGNNLFELPDPCLPTGLKMTLDGKVTDADLSKQKHFLGTGKFEECLKRTYPLLRKDVKCDDEPCLINGVHVPPIDFDVNHFVGISQYWHTTHEIFEADHDAKAYDFNTYQSRVKDFCEQDWATIKHGIEDKTWGKKVDEETVYDVCFRASWLINMLHDGIGIPRVGIEHTDSSASNGTTELIESGKEKGYLDPFRAVDKIKSTEVSWTLGKMVLYASADVPAPEDSLPVGFGSNEPGIPKDFHYPGGGRLQNISDITNQGSLSDQIHDTLFNSDSSHRLPGFIFFLLIVIIATFYLCGRERRARIYSSLLPTSSSNRKGKAPASSSLLSTIPPFSYLYSFLSRRHSPNYDRTLEEGATSRLYDPEEFELGDIDSDSDPDDKDHTGKMRSGYKTPPRLAGVTSAGGMSGSPGRRIRPAAIDRRGIVVRTESRENIKTANERSKSRNGSPNRLKASGSGLGLNM